MKKFLGTLTVMLCLAAMPASSQIKFGVKGGFTRASLKFDESSFFGKGHYGWFIGPSVKIGLPLMLGADGAVLYDQREVKIANEEAVKIKQISIPINARLNLPLAAGSGLYAAVGPQFAFNVGSSEFTWDSKDSYERTFQLKKSAFSINLGAGVFLAKHLEVGFAYNIELGNTGEITWNKLTDKSTYDNDTRTRTWRIQATIYL